MDYLSKYFKPIVIILGLIMVSELGLIGFKNNELATTPGQLTNRVTSMDDRAQASCKVIAPAQCEPLRELTTNVRTAIHAANGDSKALVAISRQLDKAEMSLQGMEHSTRIVEGLPIRLHDACKHLPAGHPDRPPSGTCSAILGTTALSVF